MNALNRGAQESTTYIYILHHSLASIFGDGAAFFGKRGLLVRDSRADQKDMIEHYITLALHGLEEPFFISSCAVVSVFCSGRI